MQQVLIVKRTRQLYYSDTALDSMLSSFASPQAETDSVQPARVRTLRKNGKLTAIVRRNYGLSGDSFFTEEEERASLLVAALTDFRPLVQVPGKQHIYFTPALAETLTAFLGTPYTPVSHSRCTQPAYAKQQRLKRQAFLERHVQLRYGNWGWQLVSDPLVYSITLD
jgi:hypothetical protein